jgi:hypothetical protein
VSVTFPVDGLGGGTAAGVEGGVGGGVGGGVDGGVEEGVLTTGAGGCSNLAIEEFWSKFTADRDPLEEGADSVPAEATGRPASAPADGEGALGPTAAVPAEASPENGTAIGFVTGAVALVVSAVICGACPSVTPDVEAVPGVEAGAVIEPMAGCLVNARCCGDGAVAGGTDGL